MRHILRSTILTIVLGAVVLGAFWWLGWDRQRRAYEQLRAFSDELEARLRTREAMIERLSRSRRVAHLHVVGQTRDETGGIAETTVVLVELDDDGTELARQTFTVPGDTVMIDGWTVKFDREAVAEGHLLVPGTLLLLRRVYSEDMRPRDGLPIDTPGAVPPAYAVGEAGEFQQRVWKHFWSLATDPKLAAKMGVRVAQGEAVYKPVRTGQVYELTVDAIGGMNLRPLAESERIAIGRDER